MKKVLLFAAFSAILFSGCFSEYDREIEFYTTKPENIKTFEKKAKEFCEKKKGLVTIKVVSPQNANDVLRKRVERGDCPDVVALGGDFVYTELVSKNAFLNLENDKLFKTINKDYIEMIKKLNPKSSDIKAGVFAIPYGTNVSGIIYNEEIFDKLKMKEPETWSELIEVCDKLKANGVKPFEFAFADEWTCLPPWNSMVSILVNDYNTESLIQELSEGNLSFEKTHREVLQKYLKLISYNKDLDMMSTTYDSGNKNFADGKAAMLINGNWAITEILKYNPDIQWKMFPFPASENKNEAAYTSGIDVALAISAQTKKIKYVKQFIQFLLETENAQDYSNEQFSFMSVDNTEPAKLKNEDVDKIIKEKNYKEYPDHYYPANFGSELSRLLSQMALNSIRNIPDEKNIDVILLECDRKFAESFEKQQKNDKKLK